MFKKLAVAAFTLTLASFSSTFAQNSSGSDKKCPPPAYAASQVSRRAKILKRPDFSPVMEVFRNAHDHVRLEAVLCRTGHVTDIRVTQGSSPTVVEFVKDVVGLVRFIPAELNLHSVSQKIHFEFEINNGAVKEIIPPQNNGMLVESVDIIGNRRLTATQIREWIQTRAGEPYVEAQVKLDFKKLLATGQFDKLTTRVFTEDGVRGGVGVYFELHELPLVGEVSFEGLKIDPALVRQAWKDAHVNLQTGEPYTPEAGNAGIRVIKQVLDSRVLGYSKVELRAEMLASQDVNLTFVITDQ